MLVNAEQYWNAFSPMDVIEFGSVTLVNAIQLIKQLVGMLVNLFESVALVRLVHWQNAEDPNEVSEFGTVTLCKDVQQ